MTDPGVIQVIVPPALRPALERWLASCGMRLFPIPTDDPRLPTFGIDPFADEHVSGHGVAPPEDRHDPER